MIFQLLMIVWLSTGPEFISSGWLADETECQSFARQALREYPRGTKFDAKCIEGYHL